MHWVHWYFYPYHFLMPILGYFHFWFSFWSVYIWFRCFLLLFISRWVIKRVNLMFWFLNFTLYFLFFLFLLFFTIRSLIFNLKRVEISSMIRLRKSMLSLTFTLFYVTIRSYFQRCFVISLLQIHFHWFVIVLYLSIFYVWLCKWFLFLSLMSYILSNKNSIRYRCWRCIINI